MNDLSGLQSALNPFGPEARAIREIAWVLFAGAGFILALVVALAWLALRGPRPWLGSKRAVIAGGVVMPVVVLSALMLYTVRAAPRATASPAPALIVEVVGYQWWWRLNYLDAQGRLDFTTANELRLPVGRPVELRLRSGDVLHSFWVPALAGKLDLVPGKDNRLTVQADHAGAYRGQCAEYCGGPHAQMAMWVLAEEGAAFEQWRNAQRLPHRAQTDARTDALARAGERLFMAHCAACHTVRGTGAAGQLGPDLTHLASRRSLGAGILPNDPASLAGWISSNQHLKPGNLMPAFTAFTPDELQSLTAYLRALD
jgi:cytochrome c oxidase subunit 2